MSDAYDSIGSEELSFYIKELQGQGVETFAAQVYGENSIVGTDALVSKPSPQHIFTIYKNLKKIQDEAERLARVICRFKNKQAIGIRVEIEGEKL